MSVRHSVWGRPAAGRLWDTLFLPCCSVDEAALLASLIPGFRNNYFGTKMTIPADFTLKPGGLCDLSTVSIFLTRAGL